MNEDSQMPPRINSHYLWPSKFPLRESLSSAQLQDSLEVCEKSIQTIIHMDQPSENNELRLNIFFQLQIDIVKELTVKKLEEEYQQQNRDYIKTEDIQYIKQSHDEDNILVNQRTQGHHEKSTISQQSIHSAQNHRRHFQCQSAQYTPSLMHLQPLWIDIKGED